MADKKRLIDANALIAEYDRVHVGAPGGARKLMEDAPTVDAVEVVRCKDCAKCSIVNERYMCDRRASMMSGRKVGLEATLPHHFCAMGERRNDDGR